MLMSNNMRSNLADQILNLLFNNHEFESSQDYWRITWSLISRLTESIKIHTN